MTYWKGMPSQMGTQDSSLLTALTLQQAHQRGWVFRGNSVGNLPRG